MTAPTPDNPANERPRYRPGQITTARFTDPTTGDQLTAHAVVLKVNGDTADLALIGLAHVQVHVDQLAPAKVDDVHNPLPAPAEGSGGA